MYFLCKGICVYTYLCIFVLRVSILCIYVFAYVCRFCVYIDVCVCMCMCLRFVCICNLCTYLHMCVFAFCICARVCVSAGWIPRSEGDRAMLWHQSVLAARPQSAAEVVAASSRGRQWRIRGPKAVEKTRPASHLRVKAAVLSPDKLSPCPK